MTSKELMDKVWDAYWQPEPHGTQAALERVVALVLEESADEIRRLRTALEHAKPYVDTAVKSAQQRGAVSMADILVPEIVSGALRSAPDYRGEVPALQSGSPVRDDRPWCVHAGRTGMTTIDCPCTTFEQDEDCPVGYPSLLCSVCGGKGIAPIGDVVAMAAEMMKVAEQVDELEDPFAAWESIELLKSERERLIAPKQSFTWSDLPGGAKRAIVTELQKARSDFMISDFEVAERIVAAFDALIKAEMTSPPHPFKAE